jgi:hypothetical protein
MCYFNKPDRTERIGWPLETRKAPAFPHCEDLAILSLDPSYLQIMLREVHMSDLIRAHEANDDVNPTDPTKIHWGKFNMMGRFINSTTQCQAQCRAGNDYNFPKRQHISEMLLLGCVMNDEVNFM